MQFRHYSTTRPPACQQASGAAPCPTASRGFTLIELLVTIVVIGVMLSSVAVSMQSVDAQARLNDAMEELDIQLNGWTSLAAIRNQPLWVSITPGATTLNANYIGGSSESEPLIFELSHGVGIDAVRMEEQVYATKMVRLLVQPSGFLRSFDLRLALDAARSWVHWDPLTTRLTAESLSP